ncbi:MAG: hypothetical protein DCE90_17980 [Pseudanabaena sp.]|nr:MAG: hypothetical protein DCE90_17980 [Pseudanabaena sp.]
MCDYWYLPFELREQAKSLELMGFAYIERIDPEDLFYSTGLTFVGVCYGWKFTQENGVIMHAAIKDAVFSMCLEGKAYEDRDMKELVSDPKNVFSRAKATLKGIVKKQAAKKPRQLSLIG